MVVLPFVHTKVGVREPSSISEAVAKQVNSESTTTPMLGEIEALTLKEGLLFSTVTDALLVADSPSESVAVVVQVMVFPTSESVAFMV